MDDDGLSGGFVGGEIGGKGVVVGVVVVDDDILPGCVEAGWGAGNCLGRSTTLARGERLGAVVAGVAGNHQAFGLSIVLENVPGATMMQNVTN